MIRLVLSRLGRVMVGNEFEPRLVGVINMSPESFFEGSIARNGKEAVKIAEKMVRDGADIIDIGGMSTAPYKKTHVSEEVEKNRVLEGIKSIKREMDVTISVDTFRSKVAEAALSAGAEVVNDVTGLKSDAAMAGVISEYNASAILMAHDLHDGSDPISRIRNSLDESIRLALKASIAEDRLVIDPGIGFFRNEEIKWFEWDAYVISNLRRLKIIHFPLNVGVSRKSFLGEILNIKDPESRLTASIAAEAICVINGADSIRTHNVAESKQAITLASYIRKRAKAKGSASEKVQSLELADQEDAFYILKEIGVHEAGARILAKKAVFRAILLKQLPKPLALIIKQEMLAVGADAATPMDTILGGGMPVDVILLGTVAQISRLCKRLRKMNFSFLRKMDIANLAQNIESALAS
ncbi:MAG: dihydropteroate synthase [Conexivisphaerales archaeon]